MSLEMRNLQEAPAATIKNMNILIASNRKK